jgi:hypothetical protein
VITFTLRAPDLYWTERYGLLLESVGTVDVTGRAAHSPHHPHRVRVWESDECTGGHGTHVLDAEAVVLADTPVERSPHLGVVEAGDVVRLVYPDGRTAEYVVTPAPLRDPRLVPAAG